MTGRVFEAVFAERAGRLYRDLSPDDQAHVDRLVALLEQDPALDGRTKLSFPSEVRPLNLLVGESWVLLYHIVDGWVVRIVDIIRTDDAWWQRHRPR